MIHYHGTPISGPGDRVGRFYQSRHALVSFAAQDHMAIVAESCQSFCLDNGAFSHWKKGEGDMDKNTVRRVVNFYRQWANHPGCDWVLIPDVIEGDEYDNNSLLETFPKDLPGVPIWHLHETLERLEWLSVSYRMIALGSSGEYATPGNAKWWNRIRDVMGVLCNDTGRPRCKVHGLRMMAPDIFTKLPFSSVDSTYAGRTAAYDSRFGKNSPLEKWQRADVIACRIESFNSASHWDRKLNPGQSEFILEG